MFICLGEILVDFLPIERDGAVVGFTMHPGGAPFNVAVGLARLDQPTAFVGKVGADFFGRRLRQVVRAEGIDDAWLFEAPAPTALAFVTYEAGEPGFAFYGAGTADTLLTPDELPPALFERATGLHFGGISLARGATPEAALVAAERLRGRALVSLDINVRPRLIDDPETYRATLARAMAACDLLKLSVADVGWLAPASDPLTYAISCLSLGPALVTLTRGDAGAVALRYRHGRLEMLDIPAFSVTVADTVGAGDSFSAGVLAALAERAALSREALLALPAAALTDVLRFGAAAAALTCTRPGADPPRRDAVMAMLTGAPPAG